MTNTTGRGLAVTSPKLIYTEGGFCYAYSGGIGVPNSFTTLLEFTSSPDPYKVSLEVSIVSDSGTATSDDYNIQLTLNGEYVASWVTDKSGTLNLLMVPISFIIPPTTDLKIRAYNNIGSTANLVYVWMYGKKLV